MKVPLLDLKAQYANIRDEVRSAVDSVFESQHFILGEQGRRLEGLIAGYCQARHAVGVASGTDALLLALKALEIGSSDSVVTTAFSFFATAGSVCNAGATPVFVDIDPDTFNIDPDKIREFLEGQSSLAAHRALRNGGQQQTIKALLPVHLYGQMAPMEPIGALAEQFGLAVLEDAAQAIGAEQSGNGSGPPAKAGTIGTAGTLSFFPSKNLGAAGDAGMVLTNTDEVGERLRLLRVHGSRPKYVHHVVGYNSRLDEIQAAVLVAKFRHLEDWSRRRAANADYYRQAFQARGLESACRPPAVLSGNRHIYHQFVVRAQQRDRLRSFLTERQIGTEIYYPVPLHLQACFSNLGYRKGDLPETERASEETLALPIYPELTAEQMDYVVDSIASFYAH